MGIPTLLLGSLFYTSANLTIRRSLKLYTRLQNADIFLITEKLVASIHALITTTIGLLIVSNCSEDIMNDSHWLTNKFAWFGLPYFFYDVWAMYMTHFYAKEDRFRTMARKQKLFHFLKHNWVMMIHHLMLPSIFFPVVVLFRRDRGDYFVAMFYTCEIVIPFIAIRFILAQLKLKESPVYIFFGLLMIFVFFITRILIFPFLYRMYALYSGIGLLDVPFRIPFKCNIGCLFILLLQAYFLSLMVIGAVKVFYRIYQKRKRKVEKFSTD